MHFSLIFLASVVFLGDLGENLGTDREELGPHPGVSRGGRADLRVLPQDPPAGLHPTAPFRTLLETLR